MENIISQGFKIDRVVPDDRVIAESFLRSAREILDGSLEEYSLDQIRGMMIFMEKYIGLRDQINNRKNESEKQKQE